MRQTNYKYPFTQTTGTWKWFYRYALKDYSAFDAAWHAFQTKARLARGKRAFENQWDVFKAEQVKGLADPRTSAAQDLEQVYLLHVNERYKNLFLTQLRTTLNWGILAATVASLIMLPGARWVQHRSLSTDSAQST